MIGRVFGGAFVLAVLLSVPSKAETIELPAIDEPARVHSPQCGGFANANTAINATRNYFMTKALAAGISWAGGGAMSTAIAQGLMNNPNTGNFLRGALGMNNGQSACSVLCTDSPVPPGYDVWVTMSWKSNPAAQAGFSLLNPAKDPQYGGEHECWGSNGIGWCAVVRKFRTAEGKVCAVVSNWSHDKRVVAEISIVPW